MGRLIVSTQMTVDAVMDQNEGWFDPGSESERQGMEDLRAADALVLGRETYEVLSSFWMRQHGGFADLVNPLEKFIATTTLTEPLDWNARRLGDDVAAAVAALKQERPGSLLSYGCGRLANHLAHRGLVDEVRFWVHPVVWGDGTRPFHPGQLPIRMRLVSATTFTAGVVRLAYEPSDDA